jgi:hypothetical protein
MKTKIRFFYAISILVLFRGIFSLYNLDFFSKALSEGLIFLWIFIEFKKLKFVNSSIPISYGVFYLLWTGVVTILGNENLYEYYLYTRYFILSCLMMYISYRVNDLKRYSSNILKAIDFFVLVQIISSVLFFFILGRLERNVGTMSTTGGSLASVWPMTFVPYYFLRFIIKGRWKDIAFVAGLVFIGYASGKRAVYFLIPLSLIIIYYGFLGSKIIIRNKGVKLRILTSLSMLFFILLLGISNTDSLAQGNGFSLNSLTSAFKYVEKYSTQENVINGESIGRTSSTINTFKSLWSDRNIFIGNGLSSLRGEITYSRYNVGYGVTGLMREIISIGFIGGILYLLFYIKLLAKMKEGKRYALGFDEEVFWIWILGISGLISLLITVLGYSRVFVQSLNPIIFILVSVGISLKAINELKYRHQKNKVKK